MKKFVLFLPLILISTFVFAQTKALVGGTLIDGFGGTPIQNSVIIIEGDKIVQVGHQGNTEVPAGAEIISTEGMSVLPGLWDMHVQQASINVRDRINNGTLSGPTLYMSGPFIQKKPYPGTEAFRWGVTGVADAKAKVRKLAEGGVDCIKLIDQDQLSMEETKAVVEEAHKHNLTVVAHAHRPEEIRRGLAAGVDCFEHTGLSSAPEYPADVMELIKERTAQMNLGPLYWTPTVEGLYNFEYVRDNPEALDNDCWHEGLPQNIIDDIEGSMHYPGRLSYFQLTPIRKPTLERKVKQLIDAGVVLLIGTDSGIPMKFHCQSTWHELDVWVNEFGIDPMYALKAATYWPAKAMGVDDKYGTISEGKFADIIAVKGDVLRYISQLQDVDIVIKHGKQVK